MKNGKSSTRNVHFFLQLSIKQQRELVSKETDFKLIKYHEHRTQSEIKTKEKNNWNYE